MKIQVKLKTGNAAFAPDTEYEVGRILHDLADNLQEHLITIHQKKGTPISFPLYDANGNVVGEFKATN